MIGSFQKRLCLVALVGAAMLVPQPAQALFYSASRALKSADAKLEEGLKAEFAGDRTAAFEAFDKALNTYLNLKQKHPDMRPDYVSEQMAKCRRHMLDLFSTADAEDEAIEEARVATLATIPGEALEEETLPQNQVRRSQSFSPVREEAKTQPREVADAPSASMEEPREPLPVGGSLEERVAQYIRSKRAADAVVELDSILGARPEEAPLSQRLLLGKALVASGNYTRAIAVLEPLVEEFPHDPAVLTLAAGAQLAHGNAFSALKLLDTVLADHPKYADAYVNMAYTRFAMDPEANRSEAILYYKHALSFGAVRDPNLEKELQVKIVP